MDDVKKNQKPVFVDVPPPSPNGSVPPVPFGPQRVPRIHAEQVQVERVGNIGMDPDAPKMFGYFLNRGIGMMFKYLKCNYARIFIDGPGNDSGSTTPSWVFDMHTADKIKIQSNKMHAFLGNCIMRIYGNSGHEVDKEANVFSLGALDLTCPFRLYEYKTTWPSTADPEAQTCYSSGTDYNGFMYIRNTAGTRAIRVYLNGGWKTVTVS